MLPIICSRCQIRSHCPKKGTSPVRVENANYLCNIIGEYGKRVVDRDRLSEKHQKLWDNGKKYITFVDIPQTDPNHNVVYMTHTILHPKLEHPRERSSLVTTDDLTPKNMK